MGNTDHEISLATAFAQEHHQIDAVIETFIVSEEPTPQRAAHLMTGLQALRRHIYLEKEIVFPDLSSDELMMALMVMHRQHGQLWEQPDVVEQALAQPATTGADIAAICRALLALFDRHNSQEEPVIYPHLHTALTIEEQERLRDLLGNGELPPGWVCRARKTGQRRRTGE